jgi:cell fate (sporulation/competence/biofilm development) regulator YmcA (YheA/YmcA/DUF963 family)
VLRKRNELCDQLRRADQIQAFRSQRWQVQRLANVASRVRAIGMVMKERSASGKIEQREASQ